MYNYLIKCLFIIIAGLVMLNLSASAQDVRHYTSAHVTPTEHITVKTPQTLTDHDIATDITITQKGNHILEYQMTGLFVLALMFAAIFFATYKKVDMKWITLAMMILLAISSIRQLIKMFF